MYMSKNNNKKKSNDGLWETLAVCLIFGVPFLVCFGHLADDLMIWAYNVLPKTLNVVMLIVSVALCVYCLTRTVIAMTCNRFLPKVPMPKNKFLKYALLTLLGVLIGIFSPVWLLVLWIITCLIGMTTYSFV